MSETEMGIYARCCRLCLSDKKDSLISVFDDTETNTVIRDRILAFLSIDIKHNDRLSTMVCNSCMDKVNDWDNFKKSCCENQCTLEGWSNKMPDIHMNIHVKEEVIDHEIAIDDDEIEVIDSNLAKVKAEPVDYDNSTISEDNNLKCHLCDAEFDNKEQLIEHKKIEHTIETEETPNNEQTNGLLNEPNLSEKIEFAAGLRLIESNSTPINMESLSKIEISYIEKCKAMVIMHRTLICACHQVTHPSLKGLLSHLRALRIWFPVFTCYHCMITFTDRSSSGKHIHKCPNKDLDTLIKLSNLKKRSALKTRLYQNYKCVRCRFMFSFHEDFCKHIDEDHCEGEPPYYCICQKTFDNVEEYKDHIYVSCMVEYYCDICFVSVRTLSEFIHHAEQNHDNSEGFVLLQEDNYRKRSFAKVEPREDKEILGKRRTSTYGRALPIKIELTEYEEEKEDITPVKINSKNVPTKCPKCDKVYSSNANMIRHYRTHLDNDNSQSQLNGSSNMPEDSLYRCPDCLVVYNSKDWANHKDSHEEKKCGECNKIFSFQTELEQHRSVHLNLKVYRDAKTHSYKSTMLSPNSESSPICDICNIVCENFEDLESHKLSHEDLGDDEFEEDIEDDELLTEAPFAKYSCIPCNKHYTGYSGLWDHNKRKHSDKQTTNHTYPRQCDECEKIITSGSAFASHKQMHRRVRDETLRMSSNNDKSETPTNRPKTSRKSGTQDDEDYFTCKRCFKVFSSKSSLKTHMKLHGINMITTTKTPRNSKKFICDICDIPFPNGDALKIHQEDEHERMPDLIQVIEEFNSKPYIFTCDICVQTFTTKNALKQHKELHAEEAGSSQMKKVAAYCKYCKVPFETLESLDAHMQSEHEELPKPKAQKQTQKPFACKICKKSFLSQPALYAHQGWHKRAKNEMFLKPTSQKLLQSKQKLSKKQDFKCTKCGQQLPNDTALQIHIIEKHGNISALLTPRCEPCNQEFATTTEFENHKKLHEIVESQKKTVQFSCQFCPASFNKNETLLNHMRINHRDFVQELKCNICGRIFDKLASLASHMKVHDKQKTVTANTKPLYFCSICNMGFNVPKELRTHTITAHPF